MRCGGGEELPRGPALLLGALAAVLGPADRHVRIRAGGLGLDVQDPDVDGLQCFGHGVETGGEHGRRQAKALSLISRSASWSVAALRTARTGPNSSSRHSRSSPSCAMTIGAR